MKFLTKAKLKLAQLAKLELGSTQTDKGTLYYTEEGDLLDGYDVFVLDDDGAYITPEDGEYNYSGKTAYVENGVVIRIESENNNENDENMKKAAKLETEVVTVENFNDLVDVINEIIDVVEDLGGDVTETAEELKSAKEELSSKLTSVKEKVELASQSSNRDFENPTPDHSTAGKVKPESQLSKFGL